MVGEIFQNIELEIHKNTMKNTGYNNFEKKTILPIPSLLETYKSIYTFKYIKM